MSQQNYAQRLKLLSYAERMRQDGKYPAVLRFASVSPRDVAGMIAHAERRIGDVSHCDPSRAHLNRVLVGSDEIAQIVRTEELEMSLGNHLSLIRGTLKSRGRKAAERVKFQGPSNPWIENSKSGPPLREFVLTVHRDMFRADADCPREHVLQFLDDQGLVARFDMRKCEHFTQAGLGFMRHEFCDMLKYCRVDFDEQSVHLQGLIYDIVEEPKSARYADGRRLFRSTHHPLIGGEMMTGKDGKPWRKRGYEIAQDAIGDWFADPERAHLNIVRAEPRAAARREAQAVGKGVVEALEVDAFLDGADDPIPAGSEQARMMYALRQRIAAEAEKKGGDISKVRTHQASEIALDILAQLGVVTHETRAAAQTRREMAAVLEPLAERYGTAREIIADPDELISKVAAEAAEKRRQEDEVAARDRRAADEAAAVERLRLDLEAAEARAVAEREVAEILAAERAEIEAQRAEVAAGAAENAKQAGLIQQAWQQLNDLGSQIKAAAKLLGLSGNPVVRAGIEAAQRLANLGRRREDDPR